MRRWGPTGRFVRLFLPGQLVLIALLSPAWPCFRVHPCRRALQPARRASQGCSPAPPCPPLAACRRDCAGPPRRRHGRAPDGHTLARAGQAPGERRSGERLLRCVQEPQ